MAEIIVTEEEKFKAIESLRSEVKLFIQIQEKQAKVNNWIKWILVISSVVCVLGIGIVVYLITKPADATHVTLDYVSNELKYINNQKKLNQYDREDIAKQKADLIEREKRDSANREDIARARSEVVRLMELSKTRK